MPRPTPLRPPEAGRPILCDAWLAELLRPIAGLLPPPARIETLLDRIERLP